MQVLGVQVGGRWVRGVAGVVFFDGEGDEHAGEVLHVGDVAADAEADAGVEAVEAFDVGEAGEGAIGCWVEGGRFSFVWSSWKEGVGGGMHRDCRRR